MVSCPSRLGPTDGNPNVDHFLRSLATVQGPYAVGVILSGTGSDGTLGIGEIKAAGGVTFAQDEPSAQYPDMPRHAVASGAVDLVLPPREIGARLATCLRILSHNRHRRTGTASAESSDQFLACSPREDLRRRLQCVATRRLSVALPAACCFAAS